MAIAEQNHFATEKFRNHDVSIVLGYLTLAIIFLVVLYSASTSAGTASGDFAWMVALP